MVTCYENVKSASESSHTLATISARAWSVRLTTIEHERVRCFTGYAIPVALPHRYASLPTLSRLARYMYTHEHDCRELVF